MFFVELCSKEKKKGRSMNTFSTGLTLQIANDHNVQLDSYFCKPLKLDPTLFNNHVHVSSKYPFIVPTLTVPFGLYQTAKYSRVDLLTRIIIYNNGDIGRNSFLSGIIFSFKKSCPYHITINCVMILIIFSNVCFIIDCYRISSQLLSYGLLKML